MSRRLVLDDVSVVVRPGEVVGLAGLLGSGRSETAKAIFGALPLDSGDVEVGGQPLRPASARLRIRQRGRHAARGPQGRGHHPGPVDPRQHRPGRAPAALPRRASSPAASVDDIVETFMTGCGSRPPARARRSRELSGGNQQKVLLARLLCLNPRVLLLDEPTRGIDVGAKAEVQGLIAELAEKGLGVVLISSELEEVVEGSDTVVVLRDGAQLGSLFGDDITEDAIMDMIAGRRGRGRSTSRPAT